MRAGAARTNWGILVRVRFSTDRDRGGERKSTHLIFRLTETHANVKRNAIKYNKKGDEKKKKGKKAKMVHGDSELSAKLDGGGREKTTGA